MVKTYEYDSFGNEVKPDGKDANPFRYCGEYYDKETEEVYLRARYYQPAVGRFLTRDSYIGESEDPLSLHLYTYCENDGVNMVDPSGHDANNVLPKPGPSPNIKKILNVRLYGQNRGKWCGPACLQMIVQYKKKKLITQRKLHKYCTGDENNTDVTIGQIRDAARRNGIKSSSVRQEAFNWQTVQKQIEEKSPVIARIGWKKTGVHFVVIKGYEWYIGERYLYINDPWPQSSGQVKRIKYPDFVNHAYGKKGGEGKWTHSLGGFKKKK